MIGAARGTDTSGSLERAEDLAQMQRNIEEFRADILEANNNRDMREAAMANENRMLKLNVAELNSKAEVFSHGHYQSIKSQAESMSNLGSFTNDQVAYDKMTIATDIFCRDRMVFFALNKEVPDVVAAKKYLSEGLRLQENFLAGGIASLQTPMGKTRYTIQTAYFQSLRAEALATHDDSWTPVDVIQVDSKRLKVVSAQVAAALVVEKDKELGTWKLHGKRKYDGGGNNSGGNHGNRGGGGGGGGSKGHSSGGGHSGGGHRNSNYGNKEHKVQFAKGP
jgi:uncharacterized membrane protein YgcG